MTDPRSNGGDFLGSVHVLRLVAAGFILISHSAVFSLPAESHVWSVRWGTGVNIFFIISGFIMYYLSRDSFGRPGAWKSFLLRRIIRIVPSYWLLTAVLLAAALVAGSHARNVALAPAQIVTSFAFIPWPRGDGRLNPILAQGWTLNYEMFFYVAFAAALMVRRGLTVLSVLFIALVALRPLIPGDWFVLRFWAEPIILEFLAGMGIAHLYVRGLRIPGRLALAIVGAGAALLLIPKLLGPLPPLLICAAVILREGAEDRAASSKLVRFGGDASYALYLTHYMVVFTMAQLGSHLGFRGTWLLFGACMVSALVAGSLYYSLIERPMTRYLRRKIDLWGARYAAAPFEASRAA